MNNKYIELDPSHSVIAISLGGGCACKQTSDLALKDIKMLVTRKGSGCACDTPRQIKPCSCKEAPQYTIEQSVLFTLKPYEIDEDGRFVFELPDKLFKQKKGWYLASFMNGCKPCSSITMRIGKRCQVFNFESFRNIKHCHDCPPLEANDGVIAFDPAYAPRKIERPHYDCRS